MNLVPALASMEWDWHTMGHWAACIAFRILMLPYVYGDYRCGYTVHESIVVRESIVCADTQMFVPWLNTSHACLIVPHRSPHMHAQATVSDLGLVVGRLQEESVDVLTWHVSRMSGNSTILHDHSCCRHPLTRADATGTCTAHMYRTRIAVIAEIWPASPAVDCTGLWTPANHSLGPPKPPSNLPGNHQLSALSFFP
jgi:hypothetical protein